MKTRSSKTKTKKKTSGARRLLTCLAAALLLTAAVPPIEAKKKQRSAPEPSAIVAGTAFRPPGFGLPGAKAVLTPQAAEAEGVRLKRAEALTDARGEFAFRVPAVPARWTIRVEMKGYLPLEKSISVEGEQRLDLSFRLEPEARLSTGGEK